MFTIRSIFRIILVFSLAAAPTFSAPGLAFAKPAAAIDIQQAYIKASNTGLGDQFGSAIAISGDTLVVGAPYESSSATGLDGNQADDSAYHAGAVYVFTHSGGVWSQQAYIKASNTGAIDGFGSVVAIDGDTLVVGAPREDSNAAGINGDQADNSAYNSGAAYVFTRSAGVWSQQAYIKASNPAGGVAVDSIYGDLFGSTVAISGNTLVVGAPSEDSNATGINGNQDDNSAPGSGAAYVFVRAGSDWSQQAYVKASNPDAGDMFAFSVSIDGDTLAVGAEYESSNATGVGGNQADNSISQSGAAYVFTRSGSDWSQQAYIKASNPAKDAYFGAVALSNDTLVAGAYGAERNTGAAYVFTRSGSDWSQQAYLQASDAGLDDAFGRAVAVSGDKLIVGADGEDSWATGVNGDQSDSYNYSDSGAAYVFVRNDNAWSQDAYVKASNTDQNDSFGTSVAILGDTFVVGANGESSGATGVNGNQGDGVNSDGSGAVYVLALPLLVVSSAPADPTPTNAANVNFRVAFAEPVTGVDAGDFGLTITDDVSGASITGVSGGPITYTVAVATGSGSAGTLRLDVIDDDSIRDADLNPLGGVGAGNGDYTDGQAYTIDRVAPLVTSMYVLWSPLRTNHHVDICVQFSEFVSGADDADFSAISIAPVTGASIRYVEENPKECQIGWIVALDTGQGIGKLRLKLADDDSIVDNAGNPLGGVGAGNGNFTSEPFDSVEYIQETFFSTPAQDGWILESGESSNAGGSMSAAGKILPLGDDAQNRQYRAILSFDTSSLPDNAVVTLAGLYVGSRGLVGKNPFTTLGKLWVDIRKGPFGGNAALQLADFNAPASAARLGYLTPAGSGVYGTNNLTPTGRKNISKTGPTQFRLYFNLDDNNNHRADYIKLLSSSAASLGFTPHLYITYCIP